MSKNISSKKTSAVALFFMSAALIMTASQAQAKLLTQSETASIRQALIKQGWPETALKKISGSPKEYSSDILIESEKSAVVLSLNGSQHYQFAEVLYPTGATRDEVVNYLEFKSPRLYYENTSSEGPSNALDINDYNESRYKKALGDGAVPNPGDDQNLWSVKTQSLPVFNRVKYYKNEYGQNLVDVTLGLTFGTKFQFSGRVLAAEFKEILFLKLSEAPYQQYMAFKNNPDFSVLKLEVFGLSADGKYVKSSHLITGYDTSSPTLNRVRDLYFEEFGKSTMSQQEIKTAKLFELKNVVLMSCKRLF